MDCFVLTFVNNIPLEIAEKKCCVIVACDKAISSLIAGRQKKSAR